MFLNITIILGTIHQSCWKACTSLSELGPGRVSLTRIKRFMNLEEDISLIKN